MDNYFINDYMEGQLKISSRERKAIQKRRERAIDLFEKGIGVEEIAEILEVTENTVRKYLGKRRLEGEEELEESESIESEKMPKSKSESAQKVVNDDEEHPKAKSGKLTFKMVDKLTDERNELIKQLHGEGLTLAEVAKRVNLTLDQAKEIYLTLGLSIYTSKELRNMREEEAKREEEERKEKAKERRRKRDRERRERIKAEKEKQEEASEEAENEDENEEKIESFHDIKKAMGKLIREGHSKKAIDLGEYYIDHADFISDEERSKLFAMVDFIKVLRQEYQEQHEDEKDR